MNTPRRRIPVQYVFVDVIGFTHIDRTVEDMLSIIEALNEIVREVLKDQAVKDDDLILLPTGDGMCIAMLNQSADDTHLEVAESIRDYVNYHNQNARSVGERFDLHLAVHEGKDILIKDINGNRNIIGAGINRAARLMNFGGPREIIISEVVHEGVCRDAKYKGRYKAKDGVVKEGGVVRYYSSVQEEKDDLLRDMRRFVGILGYAVGPLLTMADIDRLSVEDLVFHRVYGLGVIKSIGPSGVDKGRHVDIGFPDRRHSIRLTNEKGNYYQAIRKR